MLRKPGSGSGVLQCLGLDESAEPSLLDLSEVLNVEKVESNAPLHDSLDISHGVGLPPPVYCLVLAETVAES